MLQARIQVALEMGLPIPAKLQHLLAVQNLKMPRLAMKVRMPKPIAVSKNSTTNNLAVI
jgi:hypothetical protein